MPTGGCQGADRPDAIALDLNLDFGPLLRQVDHRNCRDPIRDIDGVSDRSPAHCLGVAEEPEVVLYPKRLPAAPHSTPKGRNSIAPRLASGCFDATSIASSRSLQSSMS